jgi:F-type H+-transporting ATPase subunit delta
MLRHPAAREYARVLIELAAEKNMVDEVRDQLAGIIAACQGNADLAKIFYHPLVPMQAKKETVTQLFAPTVADYVRNFLLVLVDKRRETLLPAIFDEYGLLADAAHNICNVEMTTALPVDPAQQRLWAEKLSTMLGKRVNLTVCVDKKLIGGAVIQIGDKRLDGSVATQLENLRKALLKKEASGIEVAS